MIRSMFERYTPSARQVVAFANEEARAMRHSSLGGEHLLLGILLDGLGHGRVGTEHILLALAREPDGVAAKILAEHHLGAEAVRDAVRRALEEVVEPPPAAPAEPAPALRRSQP